MNPLPVIAAWLNEFPYHDCSDMSRAALRVWVEKNFSDNDEIANSLDLAVDCLIAAGIGNEAEQEQTVYGRFTYG